MATKYQVREGFTFTVTDEDGTATVLGEGEVVELDGDAVHHQLEAVAGAAPKKADAGKDAA